MTDRNYGVIREAEKFEAFVERMVAQGKPFGFDIEASYSDKKFIDKGALQQFHPTWFLTGFSFTNSLDWARYVPIAHDDGKNVDDVVRTARALWRLLQTGLGVAHNLAYELKGISRWFRETLSDDPEVGEAVRASKGFFPYRSDTLIEVYISASYEGYKGASMKELKGVVLKAFGHKMTEFDELFREEGKKVTKKDKRFHTLSTDDTKVTNYACEDSVWCLALHLKHYEEPTKQYPSQEFVPMKDSLIYRTEMGLLPVLVEMEMEGLYLDWTLVSRKTEELVKFRDLMNEEILQELSERMGRVIDINLGSAAQLSKILFEEAPDGLGLPIKIRSEKTNVPSTSDDALKVIAKSDPIIKKILEYRQVAKLHSAYLDKYRTQLNYVGNGRAYPNHNQAGAATGRLSVDAVSYQQWPKPYHHELNNGKTFEFGFRDLLIAPDEFRIVGYDFSQVELRIMASLAKETTMIEAFNAGVDIHKATAATMMGIPLEEVTKKQRAVGKTLNFAVVYGSGAENIAEMLTTPDAPVTKEDAQRMLDNYFAAFSKLRAWMDARKAEGSEQKYVNTLFGRKYTVWEYYDHRNWIRSKGDRMCVNAPVQGGAADYMKIGMIRVNAAIKKAGLQDKIRLIMTVHDALEFYVHESVSTQTVIDLVNPCVSFRVPEFPIEIRTDWHEGYQWGGVAEVVLDENKQVTGYELEYELPWLKETHEWKGETLHEVLDQYYSWEWGFFHSTASYYAKRNPDFQLPGEGDAPVFAKGDPADIEVETVPVAELSEEEPPWLHAPEWKPKDEKITTLVLQDMPDEEQWAKFEQYVEEHPGDQILRVETPEGDVELDTQVEFTESDQPLLSLMFNGASLTFSENKNLDELVPAEMEL